MQYGPKINTNGLILYLDAANLLSYPGTGTTWTDLSGNNNNGTLTNGPTFSSDKGGCISFDGSNDFVEVANATSLNASAQTISVWYNASTLPARSANIICKHDTVGSFNGYQLFTKNSATIKVGSVAYNIGSNAGIVSTWYYLTLAYTSNVSMTLYVNGVADGSAVAIGNLSISSNPLRIGRSQDAFWSIFTGKIASVSIYNKQLTAAEILGNYNSTKARFGY